MDRPDAVELRHADFPATTLGNPANEVGFTVQRATNSSFSQNLKAFTVKANATSFADTSTQSNTRYYYRVQAFNAAGASPWSNVVNLTTAAGAVPATPTGLSAAVMSATQVRLSWTDNSTNETGFIVERAVNGGAFVSLSAVAAHNSTGAMTFNDNTVVTGNTYAYQVKAVNGATSSGYSNTASVTTSIATPTNLNGSLLSATSVRLSWTDNANNEANYKVERSPDSVTWTQLAHARGQYRDLHGCHGARVAPGSRHLRLPGDGGQRRNVVGFCADHAWVSRFRRRRRPISSAQAWR